MYFQVADISLNPLVPFLIGLGVSVLSSPTGISGGFLILPICLNFLGFTSVAVSPTNFLFNIVAMPAGLWRLAREKRLLRGLGLLLMAGSLPGILAGMILRNTWLREAADFRIFVALVLSALALNLARGLWGNQAGARAERVFRARQKAFCLPEDIKISYAGGRLSFDFCEENFSISIASILGVSLVVGLAGGIYGIGGAAIIAPLLVSYFHLPIYIINGASLLAGWSAALFGLIAYIAIWPSVSGEAPVMPDFKLGLLFGLGGMVGVYIGSALQRFLPPTPLKLLMLLLIAGMELQSFGLF